jgi:phosphohistidine phosphatase SixA
MVRNRLLLAVTSMLILGTNPLSAQTTVHSSTPTAATQAAQPTPAPAGPQPVRTLVNRDLDAAALGRQLQQGGLVLIFRHERTNVPSRGDDYSRPANDCNAQRNLSPAGVAGAAETGVAIRELRWPIGRVLSSEMCRATETARFMFGRYEVEPRLMHHDNTEARTVTVSGQEMNDLLDSLPTGGTDNTVFVSHIGNIYFAIGVRLSEGEFAVLQRQPDGSWVVLGTYDPGYIGAAARGAIMQRERQAAPTPPLAPTPARRN